MTDDLLRRVDSRWLGVPGFTFPWRPTRYVAYGIGVPILLLTHLVFVDILGSGTWPTVWGISVGIALTTYLMKYVDDERPAAAIVPLVWAELGAPRRSRNRTTAASRINLAAVAVFVHTEDDKYELLTVRPQRRLRLARPSKPLRKEGS